MIMAAIVTTSFLAFDTASKYSAKVRVQDSWGYAVAASVELVEAGNCDTGTAKAITAIPSHTVLFDCVIWDSSNDDLATIYILLNIDGEQIGIRKYLVDKRDATHLTANTHF